MLTACSTRHSSEIIADKNIQGKEFVTELARLYQDFTHKEVTGYDWKDAKYFAKKGLRAIEKIEVDPEHPEDWDVPETLMPALLEARRSLLDTVTGKIIREQPLLAAKAYFLYDCWVEELEEWQDDDIENCRNGLYETLDMIENPPAEESADNPIQENANNDKKAVPTTPVIAHNLTVETEDKNITRDEKSFIGGEGDIIFEDEGSIESLNISPSIISPQVEIRAEQGIIDIKNVEDTRAEEQDFYIFFDENSAEISEVGQNIITEIVSISKAMDKYAITVLGYISKAEESGANNELADSRANGVVDLLVAASIAKENIESSSFAENNELVTQDTSGLDKTNRRVEVYIK